MARLDRPSALRRCARLHQWGPISVAQVLANPQVAEFFASGSAAFVEDVEAALEDAGFQRQPDNRWVLGDAGLAARDDAGWVSHRALHEAASNLAVAIELLGPVADLPPRVRRALDAIHPAIQNSRDVLAG